MQRSEILILYVFIYIYSKTHFRLWKICPFQTCVPLMRWEQSVQVSCLNTLELHLKISLLTAPVHLGFIENNAACLLAWFKFSWPNDIVRKFKKKKKIKQKKHNSRWTLFLCGAASLTEVMVNTVSSGGVKEFVFLELIKQLLCYCTVHEILMNKTPVRIF